METKQHRYEEDKYCKNKAGSKLKMKYSLLLCLSRTFNYIDPLLCGDILRAGFIGTRNVRRDFESGEISSYQTPINYQGRLRR